MAVASDMPCELQVCGTPTWPMGESCMHNLSNYFLTPSCQWPSIAFLLHLLLHEVWSSGGWKERKKAAHGQLQPARQHHCAGGWAPCTTPLGDSWCASSSLPKLTPYLSPSFVSLVCKHHCAALAGAVWVRSTSRGAAKPETVLQTQLSASNICRGCSHSFCDA